MITITTAHIEQLRTPQGGFNMASMQILGNWPLSEGWKERIIGLRVSDKNWKAALKAKDEERYVRYGAAGRRRR